MASDFIHLHLHTHYSLLDGACTVKGLIELAKEHEMDSMAITDHGYMGGAQEFYKGFKGAGLNPIIGMEAYVTPFSRKIMEAGKEGVRGNHLVLLAENDKGYHNLCKLISEGFRTGFYYKPRIDLELLREYHEGIIALSACIGGAIPEAILNGNRERAEQILREYVEIFGKENFFIELMDHGLREEKESNRGLIELARKYELPLVATNDVHYLRKEHARAHEIMLCIQTGARLADQNRFKFETDEFYFKSPAEMKELFREVPEAVTNTRLVAERCSVEFKYVPEVNHYPVYRLPDGTVPGKDFLRDICLKNIPRRYGFDPLAPELDEKQKKLIERMDYELGIIDRTHYCSYFLVVSDFIRHAKEQGVPVGPGRGSGAGSLVAYLTLITDIDPLRYDLLFERFLNPERVSPPDFDIDFCEKRRGEVIEYVRQKYGYDSVAQICTYGQLKAKAVVKDVCRVLGYSFEQGNQLSKLIPEDPKMNLHKAYEASAELRGLIEKEEWVKTVWDHAQVLEGLNRQLGIHAAGVIIGDQRLDNLVPLTRGAGGEMITEFPSVPCEELGLLKMDFLGLRTLTIIDNALRMIKKNHGIAIDTSKLPLDDPPTFELLRRGDTIAVFQLESPGMQNLCRSFGVETMEHIIALIALYRPGPMQFIPEFVSRKKGIVPIVYENPKMEQYLHETYGIMVYQEQIMQVVQVLAGFTLGGADILRRAIGKKKVDVLAKQKSKFIEGCDKCSGIPANVAEDIWAKIETFAGYGFNKSHSAAYAFVSYQTAYLKANYPHEFMSAMLTGELANADEIAFLIRACVDMGIPVLPPDVNSSDLAFGTDGKAIRFGLGAIKGVGESAAGAIIESRDKEGPFRDFEDFCERCGSALNARMIEYLTRAGAFSSLGLRRSQILAVAEPMMAMAAQRAKDRAQGQGSLFDLLDDGGGEGAAITIPDIPEFGLDEILRDEKALLGFYVTGHPLDPWAEVVKALSTHSMRDFEELETGTGVRLCGLVGGYEQKLNKTGKPFGVLQFEDLIGGMECMLYESALRSVQENNAQLAPGEIIVLEVRISRREEGERPRLMVDRVLPLAAALAKNISELHLHVYEDKLDATAMENLAKVAGFCGESRGDAKLVIGMVGQDDEVIFMDSRRGVEVGPGLLTRIDELRGPGLYRLKAHPYRVAPRRQWSPRPNQGEASN